MCGKSHKSQTYSYNEIINKKGKKFVYRKKELYNCVMYLPTSLINSKIKKKKLQPYLIYKLKLDRISYVVLINGNHFQHKIMVRCSLNPILILSQNT